MSKHKRKGFDPFNLVVENSKMSAGIMIGTYTVSKIGEQLPSSSNSKIIGGMDTMAVLPTVHAAGGAFESLNDLNKKIKRRR